MALDFEIKETYNPNILILWDLSDWGILGAAEVSILAPECETPVVIPIDKNLINTFTPAQFPEITTEHFPDGIYEIILRDADLTETVTKKHLRVTRIKNEIDKMYINCLVDCGYYESEFIERLDNLNLYIDSAEAHLRNSLDDKANYMFKTALKRVNNLSECKSCK